MEETKGEFPNVILSSYHSRPQGITSTRCEARLSDTSIIDLRRIQSELNYSLTPIQNYGINASVIHQLVDTDLFIVKHLLLLFFEPH